jgi:hypothetical protein
MIVLGAPPAARFHPREQPFWRSDHQINLVNAHRNFFISGTIVTASLFFEALNTEINLDTFT